MRLLTRPDAAPAWIEAVGEHDRYAVLRPGEPRHRIIPEDATEAETDDGTRIYGWDDE